MKTIKSLFVLFVPIMCWMLFQSSSNGRATQDGTGNTGAPGDQTLANQPYTCVNCHNNGPLQIGINLEVLDSNNSIITEYEPSQLYKARVTLTATSGTPAAYGFQIVNLIDSDNSANNSWTNPATNVKIATAHNGRRYAEHNNPSTSNVFEVYFTAPDSGAGSITLYTAGNGVNLNTSNSGDGAAITKITLQEKGAPSNINEQLFFEKQVAIYPNPASQFIQFQGFEQAKVSIFNLNGKLIFTDLVRENSPISVNSFTPGVYFVSIDNGSGFNVVKKVLKY